MEGSQFRAATWTSVRPAELLSEKSTVADPSAELIASVSLLSAAREWYKADSSNLAIITAIGSQSEIV